MTPKALVERWVERFNAADIDGLMQLYADDAVNHQVVAEPLVGRDAIRRLFEVDFGRATMICLVERLHEAPPWVALQWHDPLGLRGCAFFLIQDGKIVRQEGYFDQLSFFRIQKLPVPDAYLK